MSAWIVAAPFLLTGSTSASLWINVIAGGALIALSIPKGKIKDQYGGWERFII